MFFWRKFSLLIHNGNSAFRNMCLFPLSFRTANGGEESFKQLPIFFLLSSGNKKCIIAVDKLSSA
jgi:hypothetical protein